MWSFLCALSDQKIARVAKVLLDAAVADVGADGERLERVVGFFVRRNYATTFLYRTGKIDLRTGSPKAEPSCNVILAVKTYLIVLLYRLSANYLSY